MRNREAQTHGRAVQIPNCGTAASVCIEPRMMYSTVAYFKGGDLLYHTQAFIAFSFPSLRPPSLVVRRLATQSSLSTRTPLGICFFVHDGKEATASKNACCPGNALTTPRGRLRNASDTLVASVTVSGRLSGVRSIGCLFRF
jgi:hypothetical protein